MVKKVLMKLDHFYDHFNWIVFRNAIVLSPSSGQPYNQLALLETSRGDKLATVFYYVRSIAVRNPFPAATSNLALTLNKANVNGE